MWFSAMLKVLVSVGGSHAAYWRTVVVFEAADDWTVAAEKALSLGAAKEDSYTNPDGEHVTHRFLAVETLDLLGEEITDGREVYFESSDVGGDEIPTVLPSTIPPGQSGV